uniref:Uncharacterized protein n=1 Tax=Plectus sambesii TaxID=2011161 RepID=A0A914UJV6_9BILA
MGHLLDALSHQNMSLRLLLLSTAFAVIIDQSYGASSPSASPIGKWTVSDENGTCITFQAMLSFKLSYTRTGDQDLSPPVTINVPVGAHADNSTCNTVFPGDPDIKVQILRLSFWGTWWCEFHFTKDKNKLGAPGLQQYFNLFQVIIYADYVANRTLFPNSNATSKEYYQTVNPSNGDGALAQILFAAPQHTFVCPSKQDFLVVQNPDGVAYLLMSNVKVQAFATTSDWMTSEICPQDQTPDDPIPVVAGALIAVLIAVTLIGYLIYRCRLPPETLHKTNPNSHFEEVAFDNQIDVLDDETSSETDSHPRLRNHPNGKH